jgi:hypothetical protein
MAGGVMFDWRGTPIKEGRKVVAHSRGDFGGRYVGTVAKVNAHTVTVKVLERDYSHRGEAAHITVGPRSVTVLTPDLFEEA